MPVYLALDYGERRVGIAVSDEAGSFAFGLETHVTGRDGSLLERLRVLIADRGVRALVVGLPLTADGREALMAGKARVFAARLQEEFGLDIILWDERFTSQEADRWLAGRKRKRREDRDLMAAELILQGYLDRLAADARRGGPPPEGDAP